MDMSNRKSVVRSVVGCAWLTGGAWAAAAQFPATAPEKPPLRAELKLASGQAAAGALGRLSVVLELQAVQPNIPNGLRGTVVITNPGTEAVEFIEPADGAQLEIQTAAGKALRPAAAAGQPNPAGPKRPAPVRLGPKESRRIELGVTEVVGEGPAAVPAGPSPMSPGTPRSNATPLQEGAYRVRARVRIVAAQGQGESRPSPTFESPWVEVTLGSR
jgi:hypothetical protein